MVETITLSPANATIEIGESIMLEASVLPLDATNNELKWYSSDTSIAIVNDDGQVSAISIGSASIVATTVDGSVSSTECIIQVKDNEYNSQLEFNYNEDTKEATLISATEKYCSDIIIPSTVSYNGEIYTVTTIGDQAFCMCYDLTSVSIPNSVTYIGSSAFESCNGLTSVTIPNSVTYIGDHAFSGCSGLTAVTIPNSVTSIGYGTFSHCSSLTSVEIPTSVTLIVVSAFNGCTALTNLIFEDGETSLYLGYNTNSYNSSANGKGLFYDCPLETLYLGRILNYQTDQRYGYSPFYGISTLKTLIIGASVKYIGEKCFAKCSELMTIKVDPLLPPSATRDCFDDGCYNSATLYTPDKSKRVYEVDDPWSLFLNIDITDNYKPIESETPENPDDLVGINGVGVDAEIEVYNLSGVKVGTSLNGLPKGVYVVRQGAKTTKLAI